MSGATTDRHAWAPAKVGAGAQAPDTDRLEQALFEVKRVIVGQDRMVERVMVAVLARGHCLLEGVPGIAKTLTAETFATVVGGSFARIQFTPDLVPSDIVGTRIYRPSTERFDIELGPVLANVVLADEINRAPAKVQSALLEVMSERQVSIGGRSHPAPAPFIVLATQNPIESEGIYRLPEAQRDRFLLKVDVDHAEELDELAILHRMSVAPPRAHQVLTVDELVALQTETDQVFVHPAIAHYIVQLVMATRHPHRFGLQLAEVLEYGVSARGTLGLVAASRALAMLRGRDYVLPNDVADLAGDVLAHRLVPSFEAVADGVDPRSIISSILDVVPRPRVAPEDDEIAGVAA
jgi:MoxR-like ATPase